MKMPSLSTLALFTGITLGLSWGMLSVLPEMTRAQTTKPSTDSAELQKNLRQLLDQTLEKDNSESQFSGTLGTITKVSANTFQITDTLGHERTIDVESDAVILLEGKTAKLSDLSISSGVAVMGTRVDEVVMNARRVLARAKPYSESREVILGTISDVERTQITVIARKSGETYVFTTNTRSEYEDIVGTKIARTTLDVDQSAILVATRGENNILTLDRLRLLVPIEEEE